ncbi:MAG: DUF1330 domain-containing protein [Paracoccaceae bacterium]
MIQVVASLTINPDEQDALQDYFQVASQLMEKYEGKLVQRLELGNPVIGEKVTEIIMVVEYPDFAVVQEIFLSDEYKSVQNARDRAFLKYNICLVDRNEYTADIA